MKATAFAPNLILAIGGGSVIDTAKSIAVGYFYSGDTFDFNLHTYHLGRLWKTYPIRFRHTTYNGKTKRNTLEYMGQGGDVWPIHTVEFYYEDITQDIINMVVEQLLAKQAEMEAEDVTHDG